MWSSCNFSGYGTSNLRKYLSSFFSLYFFYKIFIKFRSIFNPLKIVYWKLLRHWPTIQIIYIPVLRIRQFFIFIIIFMYLLLAFAYRQIEWHIPPLILFSTINNITKSVQKSNFTLVFFKAACHGNPEHFAGSISNILKNMFLKLPYKSWYSPKFFFQTLYKLFLCTH